MMRLIASTASRGYWPAAVSAESITASVPSMIAFATSLASARVGDHRFEHRGGGNHGTPQPIAELDDALLRERHFLEWQLDAEIAASHHHGVTGHHDRLDVLERRVLFDLGHDQ